MDSIEVRRHGSTSERVVVVLHGGPGAPGSVASLARDLARDYTVLEPLQRRHGEAPLSVAQHVADLATVAPGSTSIVGWSWGAMLGLSFAARYPERVRSLVLVGCGTYDEESRSCIRPAMDARLGVEGRARRDALEQELKKETDPATRDRLLGELGRLAMRAQSCDRVAPSDLGDELPVDAAGNEQTWKDVLRLQREGIEPAAFAAIQAPVLMLHGDLDPHPGLQTRDLLRRHVPHLEYVGFGRCGHEPWLERDGREPFLQTLRAWLAAN